MPTAPRISPEALAAGHEIAELAAWVSGLKAGPVPRPAAKIIQQAIDSATEPLVEALKDAVSGLEGLEVFTRATEATIIKARKALEPYESK